MCTRRRLAIAVIASAALTIWLYKPVSLIIYRIREPYFKYPVKTGSGEPLLRNDAHGEGDFGAKRRNGRSHSGIDILAPVGTGVRAAKSGVAFRGNVPSGYGKFVMIYHPDGYQSIYGHLQDWNIVSCSAVRQGDIIGFVGKTGNAANKAIQPHLHFEIRKDDRPQEPRGLMR